MTAIRKLVGRAALAGLAALLAILGINASVGRQNTRALYEAAGLVDQTHGVLHALEELRRSLLDAENSHRGFLLTRDSGLLAPYDAARARIGDVAQELVNRTSEHPGQQARGESLRDLAHRHLAMLAENLNLPEDQSIPQRKKSLNRSMALAAEIATLAAEMKTAEEALLAERSRQTRASFFRTNAAMVAANSLAAVVLVVAYVLVRRILHSRQQAEDAARESERFIRLLLESSGEGIYGIDKAGNCTFINSAGARLLGYQPEELAGKNLHALIHHSHADGTTYPEQDCPIYRASHARRRGARVDDEAFFRKDGSSFPVEYSSFPMRDEGETLGAVVVFSDITSRKASEDELKSAKESAEAANLAKSAFLANMSHELRTPLNAVILYSELLQEESSDRGMDDFVPDLEKIRTAGRHLLGLVNSILDLSKIEAGKMELFLERFDVKELIADVATTVQPLFKKHRSELTVDIADAIGSMNSDLTKVRQILFNLLSNAAKFTERGNVTLSARRAARETREGVEFSVSDNGIGMTAEQVEKLFQPFRQADASTTRKFGGTGLGLTIVKQFCEMMGGDANVQSEPGRGSSFIIWLPAETSLPETAEEAAASPSATSNSADGPDVLVIDDEPNARELLTRVLRREGFRVRVAADGSSGLAAAEDQRPDVIVLDVTMPRVDGWAVLTALKSTPALSDVPVVLHTMVDHRTMGFALGAAEYLTKPVERDRLVGVLHRFAGRKTAGPVLIVEDDPDTRAAVRRAVEAEGWRVREAENGFRGLEQMDETPSTILLDLMMPDMDGFEFLEKVRGQAEWDAVPIIVLTAKELTADDRERLQGSVARVLQKGQRSEDAMLREVRRIVAACARRPTSAPLRSSAG